jgi:fructokinase
MSVIALGELLIDFVALESGVSVGDASGFLKAPGGAPANVVVAMARLGHKAAFLGQVGDDPFGHYLASILAADQVDVRGLLFNPQARTALAFVANRADGERSFSFYRNPSADMLLAPGQLPLTLMDAYDVFHFGSITLIGSPSCEATLEALDYARDHHKLISYDPNLRLALWESAEAARDGMRLGLQYANIVKISEEEVEFLTGAHDPYALWQPSTQLMVVTKGAGGATAYIKESSAPVHVDGFKVQAVDTTGAGDAFMAGLLHGILERGAGYAAHLPELVRFANAVGAITTTGRGAIPSLPTLAQAQAFMRG